MDSNFCSIFVLPVGLHLLLHILHHFLYLALFLINDRTLGDGGAHKRTSMLCVLARQEGKEGRGSKIKSRNKYWLGERNSLCIVFCTRKSSLADNGSLGSITTSTQKQRKERCTLLLPFHLTVVESETGSSLFARMDGMCPRMNVEWIRRKHNRSNSHNTQEKEIKQKREKRRMFWLSSWCAKNLERKHIQTYKQHKRAPKR